MNKSATNFSKIKKELAQEHNKIRKNPSSYIPILEKQMKNFKGTVLNKPGSNYGIQTMEGKNAYQECINFLKKQKSLGTLEYDESLSKAAQDHADDIGPAGAMDHTGSNGSTMDSRVERYLDWSVTISENIDFGSSTGEDILISLIVDDGVPSRGHRKNIFEPKLQFIGVGMANHAQYEICTVIDYTGGISSYKNSKSAAGSKANNPRFQSIRDDSDKKVKDFREAVMNKDRSRTIGKPGDAEMVNKFRKMDISDKPYSLKNDPDAPEGAIQCDVKKTVKKTGNKTITTTIKTYTLDDGTQEIYELEETQG